MLGCPHCEEKSTFTLHITGFQDDAWFHYSEQLERPAITQAGFVQVESYDTEKLECGSCGETIARNELIEVEG